MKKLTVLAIGIMLLFGRAYSQSYDTTNYYGKMNYVFQHVNKNLISTGLLRDYGIEFLNLDNYSGTALHDSNFVALDEWRMLYTGLYSSQINSNANMLYLDTINRLINRYNYDSLPISFISLHYNYDKFKDNAITSNLMSVNNEQLFDVSGRPASPYEIKTLFAIAPIRQAAFTGSNQFVFRPELFLSNTGKTINSIAYKKQGSGSYQTVTFNTPFSITYDSVGFYNLDIKITYTDASVLYSHTKIVVYQNPDNPAARYGTGATPAATERNIFATKPYLSQLATGDITIDLAANNTTGQIRKPLIIVEGFDADNSWGFNGRDGLIPRLNVDINNNSLINLNQGLDDINEYDLIFLNFGNGTDYIQRNAFLLERVIEIVNSRKTTWNGTRQDNVIIGMSMGGLVARYALRDMELNSQNHETRLFISHDAPHWGANIPVGLQAAVQHLAPWQIINMGGSFPFIRWDDMFPAVVDAMDMFNSPAAKQMLIQRYTLTGQTLTADNGVHTTFLNEINNMGWPVNSKNITLSNGSCNGTKQFPDNSTIFTLGGDRPMTYFGSLWRSFVATLAGSTGGALNAIATGTNPQFNQLALLAQFPLALFSTSSSIGLDFKVKSVPSSGTQEIYRGDIYSKKKILWLINVNTYFLKCRVNSNSGMLPLDNAPGGVYDINQFGIDPDTIAAQLPSFFQGYVTATVLEPRFCFIPTASSLAINNPASNYLTPLCTTAACLGPDAVQDYFAPTVNELHISYTQQSTNWILLQQDPSVNCTKLCSTDLSISGQNNFCTTSDNYSITNLPAGATVTWSAIPSNTVTINSPNAPQTTLTKTGNGVMTLTATITNTCSGSSVTINKQITVGTPNGIGIDIGAGLYDNLEDCGNVIDFKVLYNTTYNNYSGYLYVTASNATNLSWTEVSNSTSPYWSWSPSNNGHTVAVAQKAANKYLSLKVTASNTCGSVNRTYTFGSGICPITIESTEKTANYLLSPNPAGSHVNVTVSPGMRSSSLVSFSSISIYNDMGHLKRQFKFGKGTQKAQINTDGLPAGYYYVEITNGNTTERKPLIVRP